MNTWIRKGLRVRALGLHREDEKRILAPFRGVVNKQLALSRLLLRPGPRCVRVAVLATLQSRYRAWEPTLLWNQLHSLTWIVGEIAFHEKAGVFPVWKQIDPMNILQPSEGGL
jgi:hypothetical protein